MGFPHSSVGKESACNAGEPSLIPGSGRSAEEGKGYPLQYSGLENSMDWVHGIAKSQTHWVTFTSLQVWWFLIFREQKWLPVSFHLLIALSKNVMSGAEATFFRSWGLTKTLALRSLSHWTNPGSPLPLRNTFLWEKWNLICLSR